MNPLDQTHFARLRSEKFIKDQISMIQQVCSDVDPDAIALVFHECDYNISTTISRIHARDFQDGGWQTAKSNHKKKNANNNIPLADGSHLNDGERASPTSSLRTDHYQSASSSRTNTGRRGNSFVPANAYRSLPKPESTKLVILTDPIVNEPVNQKNEQSNENLIQPSPSYIDKQPLNDPTLPTTSTLDSVQKKISSKHRCPLSFSEGPVIMHRTVQISTRPMDIQFGDVQWKNSVPIVVSPFDQPTAISPSVDYQLLASSMDNASEQQYEPQIPTDLLSNPTDEIDIPLIQATNLLLITNQILSNEPSVVVSPQHTSHLSDASSPISTQFPLEERIPSPMSSTSATTLPLHSSDLTSSISSSNNPFLSNHEANNSSPYIPFHPLTNYQHLPGEYLQGTPSWNPQASTYKPTSKIPTANYPTQAMYRFPTQQQQQQQQMYLGTYPYSSPSPPMLQLLMPMDSWPTNGYTAPLEQYSYPATNYLPAYASQTQYHPSTKYGIDQQGYDHEFFTNYGQSRLMNNDLSHGQPAQDIARTSKLSATAAAFSHGAPLTYSHFPSVDNRDNRHGASYGGNNYRNNYYHSGQQRTHHNNTPNSSWHVQQ